MSMQNELNTITSTMNELSHRITALVETKVPRCRPTSTQNSLRLSERWARCFVVSIASSVGSPDAPVTCAHDRFVATQSSLTPERRLEVLNLLNRTESLLGREAIDEGRRRIVVHGWRAEHWLLYHEGLLLKYAMSTGAEHAMVEMCGGGIDEDLLQNLLAHHESLDWWTRGSMVPVHSQCQVVRTLQLMQVALPVDTVDVPPGATLRNYEPGRDEDAWLEQNNAAFADHPEQGAWLRSDLDERASEPGSTLRDSCSWRSTDASRRRVGPRCTNCTRTVSARSTSSRSTRTFRDATWDASW